MIIAVIFISYFVSTFSYASVPEPETALAAEQASITVKTIEYEAAQFKALGHWNASLHKVHTATSKRDQLKREYDRMKALAASGGTSAAKLELAELNLQKAESDLTRSQDEVQRAKTQIDINRIKIIEEGNPGQDQRLEMAEVTLEGLQQEKKNLENSIENHRATVSYHENHVRNGKFLLDKKVISESEFERRTLELEAAQDKVQSAQDEIKGIEQAIKGAVKVKSVLSEASNPPASGPKPSKIN